MGTFTYYDEANWGYYLLSENDTQNNDDIRQK